VGVNFWNCWWGFSMFCKKTSKLMLCFGWFWPDCQKRMRCLDSMTPKPVKTSSPQISWIAVYFLIIVIYRKTTCAGRDHISHFCICVETYMQERTPLSSAHNTFKILVIVSFYEISSKEKITCISTVIAIMKTIVEFLFTAKIQVWIQGHIKNKHLPKWLP